MRNLQGWCLAVTVGILALAGGAARAAGKLELPERWFYLATNLATDENVAQAESLFARAQKAGYTGVLLTDSKLSRLKEMNKHYFSNVDKLKKSALEHHIEIVPAVFPVGWSNDILSQDPNLAEGLPVRDAVFVVKGGEARLQNSAEGLQGGDFANLKLWAWHDETVSFDAAEKALKMEAHGDNVRISQKVKLTPWREYRVTVRVKTAEFKGQMEVKAMAPPLDGKGEPMELSYASLGVPETSGWKSYTAVFNSLGNSQADLFFGSWDAKSGKAWLADAKLEEVGLLNVLRRPGAPLVVKKEAGAVLVEGKDFAAVADARLGQDPFAGEYETSHDGPAIKMIGKVPDGTRLLVSWYHPMIVYGGSVMLCPSEPKTMALLKEQAAWVHKAFGAKGYFMSHDEIRVMNWCAACQAKHQTPGELLAENVRGCIKILRAVNPGGKIYVWSDMFDPNHNAHDNYYLVNGDLAKSWLGLDKDVTVMLWDIETREKSMAFFAGLGNKMMIAGYYDSPVEDMGKWLETAGKYPEKVVGTMYTTWGNNFGDLEKFESVVDGRRK